MKTFMKWNWISRSVVLSLLAVVLLNQSGCTSKNKDLTPVKVLETYIEISFNAKGLEDKKKMGELLTGDTQNRLLSWSDEQFIKAFIDTKRKFQSLKVLENKKVSDSEAALTYELTYQEGEGDRAAKISQRKLCVVTQVENIWKIKEVRSIRESIEYLKELSLP